MGIMGLFRRGRGLLPREVWRWRLARRSRRVLRRVRGGSDIWRWRRRRRPGRRTRGGGRLGFGLLRRRIGRGRWLGLRRWLWRWLVVLRWRLLRIRGVRWLADWGEPVRASNRLGRVGILLLKYQGDSGLLLVAGGRVGFRLRR